MMTMDILNRYIRKIGLDIPEKGGMHWSCTWHDGTTVRGKKHAGELVIYMYERVSP